MRERPQDVVTEHVGQVEGLHEQPVGFLEAGLPVQHVGESDGRGDPAARVFGGIGQSLAAQLLGRLEAPEDAQENDPFADRGRVSSPFELTQPNPDAEGVVDDVAQRLVVDMEHAQRVARFTTNALWAATCAPQASRRTITVMTELDSLDDEASVIAHLDFLRQRGSMTRGSLMVFVADYNDRPLVVTAVDKPIDSPQDERVAALAPMLRHVREHHDDVGGALLAIVRNGEVQVCDNDVDWHDAFVGACQTARLTSYGVYVVGRSAATRVSPESRCAR